MAHSAAALPGRGKPIASPLTDGLVALGLDVTLFTTLDSLTAAELDRVVAAPAKLWRHSQSSVFVSCFTLRRAALNDSWSVCWRSMRPTTTPAVRREPSINSRRSRVLPSF